MPENLADSAGPASWTSRGRARIMIAIPAAIAAACLGIAALTLLGRGPSVPRNVVLVVIDTLRADHLGAYGYERPTSPFLDALAATGVLFENAVSAAPATFPSVNTLLTSQSPSVFHANNARDLGIPAEMTTLAEVFREAGFRTAAVSASPIVRRSPSRWNIRGGFNQGFEQFDERCSKRSTVVPYTARCVTDQALRLLSSFGSEPFFLYVHYLDPHDPYQPPRKVNAFVTPYTGDPHIRSGRLNPVRRWLYEGGPDPRLTDADVQHLRNLYDGEIRAVDANLRRLLDAFAEQGRLDDTLFVFLSDHGESFLEHRHIGHGKNVYQPELHIPLIFYWPARWQEGLRRRDVACTIDVMPTILALAGLPIPAAARGVPLFGAKATSPARHPCYTEGRPDWHVRRGSLMSLRVGTDKIIFHRRRRAYEVYDLAVDPDEANNLAARRAGAASPRVAALKRLLHSWPDLQAARGAPEDESGVILDPEAEQALRALGYIE